MTEAEWLACNNPRKMLEAVRRTATDRKLRLFAVSCCRRVWPKLDDERSRKSVEVAERYADELATDAELSAAAEAAHWAAIFRHGVAFAASRVASPKHDHRSWWNHAAAVANFAAFDANEREPQVALLRCIIGNPTHPTSITASLCTDTVVGLARTIYEQRTFDRLPILADALEEAGCADARILEHCRNSSPHVRGCWVVDLMLGRS